MFYLSNFLGSLHYGHSLQTPTSGGGRAGYGLYFKPLSLHKLIYFTMVAVGLHENVYARGNIIGD